MRQLVQMNQSSIDSLFLVIEKLEKLLNSKNLGLQAYAMIRGTIRTAKEALDDLWTKKSVQHEIKPNLEMTEITSAEIKLMDAISRYSKSNISKAEIRETVKKVLDDVTKSSRSKSVKEVRPMLNADIMKPNFPDRHIGSRTPNTKTWESIKDDFNSEKWRNSPANRKIKANQLNSTLESKSSRKYIDINIKQPFVTKEQKNKINDIVSNLKSQKLKVKSIKKKPRRTILKTKLNSTKSSRKSSSKSRSKSKGKI